MVTPQPISIMKLQWTTFLSPAKLNLGLKIVGKRSDGYHLLKTIFCLINLFDEVRIQIIDSGKISLIEHNQAWSYHKDLAYKAAVLLKKITACQLGANIKIKKTIPAGSGLGGGSSNAATVLVALNQLWQTGLSQKELIKLGASLGADIPFFIHGENAWAEGIGENLTTIKIPEQYIVIICPDFHLATKDVFANLDLDKLNMSHDIDVAYLLSTHDNDLLTAAIKVEPKINNIIKDLESFGIPALTGSGSAIYLGFSDIDSAKKVAQNLNDKYNTYLVKSINASPIFLEN
jgi:4-diphosphocytidyl-2-C-methyl-D-erythritol kinase